MPFNKSTTFGFIYTFKCTAECEHCCFSCSPGRNEKLDFEIAKKVILSAIPEPCFQTVFFSGGEIFLYYDEMIELMCMAKGRFAITCATNGFWGLEYEKAEIMIKLLKKCGLTKLILSYDLYHAKFVPSQSIVNLLKICKRNFVPVEIQGMASRSWRLSHTADLLLSGITEVPVSEAAILPVGAAVRNIAEDILLMDYDNLSDRCLGSDAITIFPNGDIYPCCSPTSLSTRRLKVGNIYSDLRDCDLRAISLNKMMYYLKKYGIMGTCSRLWPEQVKNIVHKKNYVNVCDKCNHIFNQISSESFVENVKEFREG